MRRPVIAAFIAVVALIALIVVVFGWVWSDGPLLP